MDLRPGMRRNYQVFEPLDFLASVTQHIPNKRDHQIRYYGYYSKTPTCYELEYSARGAEAP
jgi:hypothetical protein